MNSMAAMEPPQTLPPSALVGKEIEISGEVKNITYRNPNGFGVIRIVADSKYHSWPIVRSKGLVTIVGMVGNPMVGERLIAKGVVKDHPDFGLQLDARTILLTDPASIKATREYLEKNAYGINKILARRITDAFGEETFNVIDNTPEKLLEIPGIGEKKYDEIIKSWVAHRKEREWLKFAASAGIGSANAARARKLWGEDAEAIIRHDPYRMAREIDSIGFKTADEIAKRLGIQELSPVRLIACIEHELREGCGEGHCFLYRVELTNKVFELLHATSPHVTVTLVTNMIDEAVKKGILIEEPNKTGDARIYLTKFHKHEVDVVKGLAEILNYPMPPELQGQSLEKALSVAAASFPYTPSDRQKEAMRTMLTNKVSVITGSPGTGKTAISQAAVKGFVSVGLPVTLLAPTGRAAKRMMEVIGLPAKTIHLELNARRRQSEENGNEDGLHYLQIRGVVLVDETSMVDIGLAAWLLSYLHPSCVLIFVGDKDQLPSVGPGAFLRDLLDSKVIPVTYLDQIFRQSAQSKIAVSAAQINQGFMPELFMFGGGRPIPTESDMVTCFLEDEAQIASQAVWAATAYATSLGFDPIKDCIVLSPQHSGHAGVANLNTMLQRTLNPNPSKVINRGMDTIWGIGDRVMQTKNNYRLEVCNGEIGQIVDLHIDPENGKLNGVTVAFDGLGEKFYDGKGDLPEYNELKLAYASTIHKMQGSEFPMVVQVLHTRHFTMLQRNLIYTGITRGKKRVVLISHPRALDMAISNNKIAKRNTLLADRLIERKGGL